MVRVCILNYGTGNVGSVYNLFSAINVNATISNEPKDIAGASHLVLPGVGAFAEAMRNIKRLLPLDLIHDEVHGKRKPFLGICVGMQVLATIGEEHGNHKGLDWIPGAVKHLRAEPLPLPHIGWNDVKFHGQHALFAGLEDGTDFYYVHSYAMVPDSGEKTIATSCYESDFCCAVASENVLGVQFHPEKSQGAGVQLIENFLTL